MPCRTKVLLFPRAIRVSSSQMLSARTLRLVVQFFSSFVTALVFCRTVMSVGTCNIRMCGARGSEGYVLLLRTVFRIIFVPIYAGGGGGRYLPTLYTKQQFCQNALGSIHHS